MMAWHVSSELIAHCAVTPERTADSVAKQSRTRCQQSSRGLPVFNIEVSRGHHRLTIAILLRNPRQVRSAL